MIYENSYSEYQYTARGVQYAIDVLEGRIPACKWVRLACRRFFTDLDRADAGSMPYVFDPKKAERRLKFAAMLPHVKGKWRGQLFDPEPWQCFILMNVHGWVHGETKMRRFRTVDVFVPRKNGKSFIAGGEGLFMFSLDGEHGAEVYSLATTMEQAWHCWKPARDMVQLMPKLREKAQIRTFGGLNPTAPMAALTRPDSSVFKPLCGTPGDGQSPSCAILDELHQWKTDEGLQTMKTGMGARSQPMIFIISTAGVNIAGPCDKEWQDCQKLLEGIHEDDTKFAIIYTIDSESFSMEVQLSKAAETIGQLCKTHNVSTTQINERLLSIFAPRATPGIVARQTNGGAPTTQIAEFERAISVEHVTNETFLSNIPNDLRKSERSKKRGNNETSSTFGNTGATGSGSSEPVGSTPSGPGSGFTASLTSNSNSSPEIKTLAAAYAESGSPFAWITTIRQKLFEGFSADTATAQSDYLAILQALLNELSATWKKLSRWDLLGSELVLGFEPDDWTSEAALIKANPGYGVSIDPIGLRADQLAAVRDVRLQADFKTKHLNIWVSASSAWINIERWKECEQDVKPEDLKGEKAHVSADAASKTDLFCLNATVPKEGKVYFFTKSYIPTETANLPENKHYLVWAKNGWLTLIPGSRVDQSVVEKDLQEWSKLFRIQDFAYDPREMNDFVMRLQRWANFPIVEINQSPASMSAAYKEFEALYMSKALVVQKDECLRWQASNAQLKEAQGGGPTKLFFVTKPNHQSKIDAIVSGCMGVARLLAAQTQDSGFHF